MYERLQKHELKDLNIALTWGNQRNEEKASVLKGFVSGVYPVLVSTTVIEVGVNNPNATIMIIENAERFGLSQLHQLRGRVGRGSTESWCFLLSDASDKLNVLCATNDGFEIARKDLELRGPGDLTGTRQSGEIFSPIVNGDTRLLDEVSRAVKVLRTDKSKKEILQQIEELSKSYFERDGHEIALS